MSRLSWHSTLLFLAILVCGSCETEFDSYIESEPVPIVYGVINPNDSLFQIRLTRSFVGEGNALDHAKINDSIYFDEAEVYLEAYRKGNLFQSVKLEKTQIDDRESGVFSSTPNYVYQTTKDKLFISPELFTAMGVEYNLELNLSVILPDQQDTVKGYARLIPPPRISNPNNNYQKVYFYGDVPFHMEWVHTFDDNYYEILITLKYKEVYDYHVEDAEVQWILSGIQYNESSIPGGSHYFYAYYFRPESFFSQISAAIKEDYYVKGRVIRNIDFTILSSDPSIREYNRIGELADDYNGASYSNIENGFGLFSTYTDVGVSNLRLGQRELDSLAFGRYTKHLNFKNWE